MLLKDVHFLTGRLLTWPEGEVEREDILRCSSLDFGQTIGPSDWERYTYMSTNPLNNEDPTEVAGPYKYAILCRRSRDRILILGESSRVVETLLTKEFTQVFAPHLRSIPIAIVRLVKAFTRNPPIYALTYAHAKVPGSLVNLKHVSFYGDDLGVAPLFNELLDELTFISC